MSSALQDSEATAVHHDPDDLDEDERIRLWLEDEHDEGEEPASTPDDDDQDDDDPASNATEANPPAGSNEVADDDVEDASEPELTAAAPAVAPVSSSAPMTPPCTIVVAQGECLLSIARRFRKPVEAIWDHPSNATLRQGRKSNQLLPGDAVFIPATELPDCRVPTTQRHRFKLTARRLCTVTLRFLRGGKPRAEIPFTLVVDGVSYEGQTDGDGRIQVRVPADAREGMLTLHTTPREERYPVRVGHLNPIDDLTGIQTRLNHLGFICGPADGILGPRTRRALRLFQRAHKLTATGEPNDATRAELTKVHGS